MLCEGYGGEHCWGQTGCQGGGHVWMFGGNRGGQNLEKWFFIPFQLIKSQEFSEKSLTLVDSKLCCVLYVYLSVFILNLNSTSEQFFLSPDTKSRA